MAQVNKASIRNRLLQIMSLQDFQSIQPYLQHVELPTQHCLMKPNRPVEHLHFLESGISSITAYGSNGRVEVGMIGREGLVGAIPVLLEGDSIAHDQFMQVGGDALRIEAGALLQIVGANPTLRRLLLRYVQTEVVQTRQTAYVNAAYNTEPRLARWLLMCHDRVEGDELLLKHEFLSMMLGVQRSGVTLALQALEGAGRIRGRRGRITITNRALLEEVAEGSYGTPEAEYARLVEAA